MKKLRVNMASESDITVQGHGVHTAYVEMAQALERRDDVEVTRGKFWRQVPADIVHLHTVGPAIWPKLFQHGTKRVISAHVVPASFIGSIVLAKYWAFAAKRYLRWFYNRADLVLAVSDETKRELKKLGVNKPIEVLPNAIGLERFAHARDNRTAIRKKLKIPESAFVVIGAGQVQPRKRVDTFVKAASKLPNVYFVWVGGMPIGKLAADNGAMGKMMDSAPSNVIFTGIVPLEDMPSYYGAADLFWLPSDQETFGMVVVEAAAAGLPILLRDIPDYEGTFKGDVVLYKGDGYVDRIIELRDSPSLYRTAQLRARNIAERFDSKAAGERLVQFYRQLV